MNDVMDSSALGPQALAERVGAKMYDRDRATQGLGIAIVEIRPGYDRMTLAGNRIVSLAVRAIERD